MGSLKENYMKNIFKLAYSLSYVIVLIASIIAGEAIVKWKDNCISRTCNITFMGDLFGDFSFRIIVVLTFMLTFLLVSLSYYFLIEELKKRWLLIFTAIQIIVIILASILLIW
jgi:hypothetical protein